MNSTLLAVIDAPAGTAAWLACASFVLMLVNQALGLKGRLLGEKRFSEIFPQPLEVKPARDPVTREYCDHNHDTNKQRIKWLEREVVELRKDGREAANKLEQKIEVVRRDLMELERRINAANEMRLQCNP